MYTFEVATLPTRFRKAKGVARGTADNSDHARAAMVRALSSKMPPTAAKTIASQAESVWTDFPEYGVMARVFGDLPAKQCERIMSSGVRCRRMVETYPAGGRVLCWQH